MGKKSRRKRSYNQFSERSGSTPRSEDPPPALPDLPELPEFKLSSGTTGPSRPPGSEDGADEHGWQEVKRPKKLKERAFGAGPSFQMSPMRIKHKLKVKELQELCLWLLSAGKGPQWLIVNNKHDIKRVVVLLVPGLTIDMFNGFRNMHDIESIAMQVDEEDIGVPLKRDDVPDATSVTTEKSEINLATSPDQRRREESPLPPMSTFTDIMPVSFASSDVPSCLKPLSEVFRHVWPTTIGSPDDRYRVPSPVSEMLSRPLDKTARKQANKVHNLPNNKGFERYLMTLDELLEDNYPLHALRLSEIRELGGAVAQDVEERLKDFNGTGWVDTDYSASATWSSSVAASVDVRCLAIDCEMCKTSVGNELARVSVVDYTGNTLYDKFVKPENPIEDYLTRYSGITEATLKDVTTTLADVQSDLLELIKQNPATILVGHSLESDLHALKLRHPFIIDTSVIYDHPRGKPYKPSLKWLAKKYLKREIQNAGAKGHDSVEDAKTCIDLLKVKVAKGPGYGKFEEDTESIFKQLAVHGKICRVVDWGNPTKFHGSAAESCVHCKSDADVVEGVNTALTGSASQPDFVWAKLHELEVARGFRTTRDRADDGSPEGSSPPRESLPTVTHRTCSHIQQVYESLPGGTAFIVYSGCGDQRQLRKYIQMQNQFREEYKVKKWNELSVQWTDTEEQLLKEGAKRAREGVAFLTVKPLESEVVASHSKEGDSPMGS